MGVADGSFLDRLSEAQRRRVLDEARRRSYKRNEVIFRAGERGTTLHLIDAGHVAIRTVTTSGDVVTLTVLGPGDVFGEQALLDPENTRTATAQAVESATTRTIDRRRFHELRTAHPEVDRFLVELLAAQVRRLSDQVQEALYVAADERVLRRLVHVAASYVDADGTCVVPLSQDDLATMAGTGRPTANRVLKALEADGFVRTGHRRIEIVDLDALRARATPTH